MYSFVYAALVAVGTVVLAQFIDGRVALLIGLALLGLRIIHLRAQAAERRQFPAASDEYLKKRAGYLAELQGMRLAIAGAKRLGKMTEAEAVAKTREIDDLAAQWSAGPGATLKPD